MACHTRELFKCDHFVAFFLVFSTVKKNLNRLIMINRLARRFKWFNRLISAPINRQLLTVNRLNHVVNWAV